MNLRKLAELYVSSRFISSAHAKEVVRVCRKASLAVGENGRLASRAQLVAWLRGRLDQGLSPASVAHDRKILQAVLNFGAREGLVPSIQLPPLKVPRRTPRAWTLEDIERILAVIARLKGRVGQHEKHHWWKALVLTAYWTAARIGSLLAARREDYDQATGSLVLRQTKSGREIAIRLHPQAQRALGVLLKAQEPMLFTWPHHRRHLYACFRKIVEQAGVPILSRRFGLFHCLRRTALTLLYSQDPALAQRVADHTSLRITRDHYVDPRLVEARGPADVLPVPRIDEDPQLLLPFMEQ